MGDVKRWSVTYTKHIKQKRKVYQDGHLELHSSGNKVMLYDDCEKLLDSRLVKKDDIIRSGETVAFDSYLVDIGDLDGDCKPKTNLNEGCQAKVKLSFQGKYKKTTGRAGLFHGRKFKHNSVPADFKKSEMNKYGAPLNSPDTTKTSITEWQVLYSMQITQKAKKYHDGILRVTTYGSQGGQVMLYDASRRLLDSRFLKKDEVIGSGESLVLDGHLVDIGEPEGDHMPQGDSRIQEKGGSSPNKKGSPMNLLSATGTDVTEWDVLYTSKVTQKAKKYHNGILKLAPCGSYRMKAILSSEDGTILSFQYLKLSETVRSGSISEVPNYLVEVGEQRMGCEEPGKVACSGKKIHPTFSSSNVDSITSSRSIMDKSLHDGEPEANVYLGSFDRPSLNATIKSRKAHMDKPLRDAQAILSVLRKPMKQEQNKSELIDQYQNSKSLDLFHIDIEDQLGSSLVEDSGRNVADNHVEEITSGQTYSGERDSNAIQNDPLPAIIRLADNDNKRESKPRVSLGSETSDFSKPNSDAGFTAILQGQPNGNAETGDSIQLMFSKRSVIQGSQLSEEVRTGNPSQPNADSIRIFMRQCEGVSADATTNSDNCASHAPINTKEQSSKVDKSASEMEECPSFNLCF